MFDISRVIMTNENNCYLPAGNRQIITNQCLHRSFSHVMFAPRKKKFTANFSRNDFDEWQTLTKSYVLLQSISIGL